MSLSDRFSLRNRVALVTGGAGPLFGSSISEALVEAGVILVTASRSLENNKTFAEKLRGQGFEAYGMQLDVSDLDSINHLHDQVLVQFGRLDILVNNAVVHRAGSFETETPADWLASAQGDMVGLFAICKAFIPDMVERGKGSIINISSIYGVVGNDPSLYEGTALLQPPHYNFVKAGMINFTRYMANYYGKKGIRVNCVSPGGYFNNQPEPFLKNYCKRVPIGRMLGNDDIKGAIVFLSSDASEYVTGINLLVDGGWTAL